MRFFARPLAPARCQTQNNTRTGKTLLFTSNIYTHVLTNVRFRSIRACQSQKMNLENNLREVEMKSYLTSLALSLVCFFTSCHNDKLENLDLNHPELSQLYDFQVESGNLVKFTGVRLSRYNAFKNTYGLLGFVKLPNQSQQYAYVAWERYNGEKDFSFQVETFKIPADSPALMLLYADPFENKYWKGNILTNKNKQAVGAVRYLSADTKEAFTQKWNKVFSVDLLRSPHCEECISTSSRREKIQWDLCNGAYAHACNLKVKEGESVSNSRVEIEIRDQQKPNITSLQRSSQDTISIEVDPNIQRMELGFERVSWSREKLTKCTKNSPGKFDCKIPDFGEKDHFEIEELRMADYENEEESHYDETFWSKDSYIGTSEKFRFPSIYKLNE